MDQTIVRAPIAGIVVRRFRKTGELVTAASDAAIISIADLSTYRVRAGVDESDIAWVFAGQRAIQLLHLEKHWPKGSSVNLIRRPEICSEKKRLSPENRVPH